MTKTRETSDVYILRPLPVQVHWIGSASVPVMILSGIIVTSALGVAAFRARRPRASEDGERFPTDGS